ncbi:DNA repair protein RadC [Rickettsiales endosymbiont of Peranema trichophorum]|uniref:RadC family protein n=1 Tax=Rickettsiales endosymbiont of Peranema trichophorum TaxID=2486577 RepID=UPI0010236242|nr:DNA repair protein RadC [Rickettsiales endosymbiont of Peranema trichophorum]RZI47686.1 DNA repair protein RadC [Rickettsiales endosymbiont of Peranema trichophorum]
MTELKTQPNFNAGHRERLRERFLKSTIGTLQDYEILEMFLFSCYPRRDTKALAKELLRKFGSIHGVLNAEPSSLLTIKGIGANTACMLKLLEDIISRVVIPNKKNFDVLSNWSAVLGYCRTTMGYKSIEVFRVLYLNRNNLLLCDEVIQEGTLDRVAVYPREILKTCLNMGASAIILVHNHPSGDPRASSDDISMTKHIIKTLEPLNISVHDHLIVSHDCIFSFKNVGLL